MIYYLLFLMAGLAVLSALLALTAAQLSEPWQGWMIRNANVLELIASAAFVFGVFGFISRRCERQADVYGCKSVSCTEQNCRGNHGSTNLAPNGAAICPEGVRVFSAALDKVALLSGVSRTKPGWLHSWQHSTIARRVDFLRTLGENPALEPRFQRSLFWVKASLLSLVALAAAALWLIQAAS